MVIRLDNTDVKAACAVAIGILDRGGIVAFPTETFYGLGVRFDDHAALERLYALKRRPRDKAMPLIIGRPEQLGELTDTVPPAARRLMERFWPGPLTLLFSARPSLNEYVTAGGKVAVRVPGDSFALSLARAATYPITATSANHSGSPPASDAAAVVAYFGEQLDLVVDGGTAAARLPSTIVDASGPDLRVLREGAVPAAAILGA